MPANHALPLLDGPRLPAHSGTAKHLVVFLHGYGADGRDLIDIGQHWQSVLPDAAFVSPHAPEPCGMAPMGRQWFALTMRDTTERWRGVQAARPTLDAFLDAELSSLGLTDAQLALVGFSQGTMMALHVGLRRKARIAAILGYSGELVGAEHLAQDLKAVDAARGGHTRPPVMLLHGMEDEVIPPQALPMSAEALTACGVDCQTHLSAGLGHGIDAQGLQRGGFFLRQAFDHSTPHHG